MMMPPLHSPPASLRPSPCLPACVPVCGCSLWSAPYPSQFFILDVLGLGDLELALVPLTIYLASLATTLAMDHVNAALGRKATLLAGSSYTDSQPGTEEDEEEGDRPSRGGSSVSQSSLTCPSLPPSLPRLSVCLWVGRCLGVCCMHAGSLVVLCASAGFYVLCPSTAYLLYPVCVVLGVGSTTVMVTSHSMANDLVDTHDGAAGGFLYGAFSLTDKLANGLLILAIQVLKEAACGSDDGAFPPPAQCSCLLRDVMSVLPALSAAVAVLAAHPVTSSSFGHVPPTPASPPTSRGGEDGQALGGVDIICTGEFRKLNLSGRYSSYVEPADQEVRREEASYQLPYAGARQALTCLPACLPVCVGGDDGNRCGATGSSETASQAGKDRGGGGREDE